MKAVVFLGDGMADRPVDELAGMTPLEKASTPHMDLLAQNGLFGLARTVPEGMPPGSDTANLSVFGYDPKKWYTGRSPLEAVSMGIELSDTDVAYRCNFVTLSEAPSMEDAVMEDYSAGEITTEEARELVDFLNVRFHTARTHLFPGITYRHCLVHYDAETGAVLTPPHDISGQPVREHLPQGQYSGLLRAMMEYSYEVLRSHPVNVRRAAEGRAPATAVWLWGEGRKPSLPSFEELYGVRGSVISAVDLVQGIGLCAGLRVIRVPGATANYHTDFVAKGRAAIEALRGGDDFVYIHVEAPDECGHRHEVSEKIYSIEQIDHKIVGPVMEYLQGCGEDYAALLMPDHPTPLSLMTHTSDPVPFALVRKGDCGLEPRRFTEKQAAETGIFVNEAHTLMQRLLRGPGL